MTTAQKNNIKKVRQAAKELRYAGYDAKADYAMVHVVIKGIDGIELAKIQNVPSYRGVCLIAA